MGATDVRSMPAPRARGAPACGLRRCEDADGFVVYRSALLEECRVPHVFTTRLGGRGRELDLGRLDPQQTERLTRAAGLPGARIVSLSQVHGAGVVVLSTDSLPPDGERGDGLVSERSDVLVCVHVADCVPILLARADGGRVAAVHAGWRGLVAGIVPRALERLGGGRRVAAIGPCLSRERFEVGPEVVEAFRAAGLGAAIEARPGARAHIDLVAAAAAQLAAAGVERIDAGGRCTYASEQEFYSYRRDVTHGGASRTGRLGALIAAALA